MTQRDPRWLAIDLPGHGRSSAPQGGFDDCIRGLLAGLPPSIDSLTGYSLGGRIALGMLRLAPQRFQTVTLISAHPGLSDPAPRAERLRQDQQWIALLRAEGIAAFVRAWERQPLFQSQARLPPAVLEAQRERRLAQRPEGLAAALACLGLGGMPSAWEALCAYQGELRWIVGGLDAKFLALARQVERRRPQTELIVMDGVGHNPLLEAPGRLASLLAR